MRWLPPLALFIVPGVAAAVEGESLLSVTPSFSSLSLALEPDPVSGKGAGVAVDYQRGLSDTFWLRAAVGGAAHDSDGGRLLAGWGTAGLTYAVDVFRCVPYVGIGVGLALVDGGALEQTEVEPYLELGIGVDYLASRRWSFGVDARLRSFATALTQVTVGPRVTFRWGYF